MRLIDAPFTDRLSAAKAMINLTNDLRATDGRPASPGPIIADLNHRLALCHRCCRTRRTAIDDGRCEICDADVPDRTFASFAIAYGAITVIGNRGACCDDLIPSTDR